MAQGDTAETLFAALAEQLKTPLLQIARLAELPAKNTSDRIALISEQALRLVDAYVQTQHQAQIKLALEPVNTNAVLYDVAQTLRPYAKQFDFEIEIDLRGHSVPIMAHRDSLRDMLSLLGASLVEAGAETEEENAEKYLVLGTHRSAKGMVVGVFSNQVSLSQKALQLTRQLHGRAAQAAPSLGIAGGASLAVADKLSEQLAAPLKAYRHYSLSGIGSLLVPSRQLQLVV